jgi:DNA-binding beta-propeller fold protein YncE
MTMMNRQRPATRWTRSESSINRLVGVLSTLLVCVAGVRLDGQDSLPLKVIHTIPLPGVKGRFDHFACDTAGQHLFVAALGNDTLEVLDVANFKRLRTITGLRKPTGLLYLADPSRIYVANGDDGTFRAYETKTFALASSLGSLADADNVRFDSAAKLIYVGYGDGALGITDPMAGKVIASVKLPGHPESFQLERSGKRIFVNLPDAKMVAVVDREKRAVVARWPMDKFQANFPMALDETTHRLFVGCRKPPRLVVFDTETGTSVSDLEISGDTDDLFFDSKRSRIYISCGAGFLDVIQRRESDRYERVARQPTRAGARTCFYSADLDRLYLAVPQQGGQNAGIRVYQPD